MLEHCGNCERVIGHMETPHVYNGTVVCAHCHEILSAKEQNAMPAAEVEQGPLQMAQVEQSSPIRIHGRQIRCPYCGYTGLAVMRRTPSATDGCFLFGSIPLMLILMLVMWIVGSATASFAPSCPICKNWIPEADRSDSIPLARQKKINPVGCGCLLVFFAVLIVLAYLWATAGSGY